MRVRLARQTVDPFKHGEGDVAGMTGLPDGSASTLTSRTCATTRRAWRACSSMRARLAAYFSVDTIEPRAKAALRGT